MNPAKTGRGVPAGEIIGVCLTLLVCLTVIHHFTLFSFFSVSEGGGDSVLSNIILEHQWRWFTGERLHRSLWSPPGFFPQPSTAGYTDLFLGVLPLYAPWRSMHVDPQTAFQLLLLTISALNYTAAYLMFRVLIRTSAAASAAGAILFTIGSPRLAQIGHPQMLPGFFIVAAFAGLYLLLSSQAGTITKRRLAAGLSLTVGGFTAQLYTGFYYAWFMAFSAVMALICAIAVLQFRSRLTAFLRQYWLPAAISTLIAAVLVAPAVQLYFGVLQQVGQRQYSEVKQYLPGVTAWFAQGPSHWIYGALNQWAGVGPNFGGQEMFIGLGPLTTLLVLFGFLRCWSRPVVAVLGLVSAVCIILSFAWPQGLSMWQFVYSYFPGAQAIRVVSRVGVFLLLPASVAAAYSLDWIAQRGSPLIAVLCIVAVLAEQGGSSAQISVYPGAVVQGPAETIVHRLNPDCKTFLVSFPRTQTSVPMMHLFGMYAELLSGIPTLNGYSGQIPPSWPIADVAIGEPQDRDRILAGIRDWMRRHPREIENVCWITPEEPAAVMIRGSEGGPP